MVALQQQLRNLAHFEDSFYAWETLSYRRTTGRLRNGRKDNPIYLASALSSQRQPIQIAPQLG
jgi:hypothetical protein